MNYFIYDGIGNVPIMIDGMTAKAVGKIKGCRLMFGSEERDGYIVPIAYEDGTDSDELWGTVWEIDNETFEWFDDELYDGRELCEREVVCGDEVITCYLHTLASGVFAIPDEYDVGLVRKFYENFHIDPRYLDKAVDDTEKEVYEIKSVS